MTNHTYLSKEAKAWVKKKSGPDEIVRVIPDTTFTGMGQCYLLYTGSLAQRPGECIRQKPHYRFGKFGSGEKF